MKTLLVRPILVESKLDSEIGIYQGKVCHSSFGYTVDDWENYQLILISLDPDEKIEVGDVFYSSKYNTIDTLASNGVIDKLTSYKVIATQDQLSPELIQQLVDEYNNGGMQDFEIEMEEGNRWNYTDGLGIEHGELQIKLTNGFVTVIEKDEIIGKPLEDYIIEKHSQDRCMGFIDGYNARKSEEPINYTEEELRPLFDECLNLIRYIDTPVGRRKYPEDVVNMVKSIRIWFNENKKK